MILDGSRIAPVRALLFEMSMDQILGGKAIVVNGKVPVRLFPVTLNCSSFCHVQNVGNEPLSELPPNKNVVTLLSG